MNNGKELTILIPCLDEADTIAVCIERARKLLSDHGIDGEVLISDNGSTDSSRDVSGKAGARVVICETKGYGAALRFGIENAAGRFVLMGDADDSYHFDEAFPMIEKLREGYDVCMGNRFKGKIHRGAMPFLHKYLGNPVLTAIGRILFGIRQGDFHCGMRAFRKDKINAIDFTTIGMEWASEMIIRSKLAGLKITEVPVNLYKDIRNRPPHLRTWRDGWAHLKFMVVQRISNA
jgi:glycosyltransferase involved in cell wall biosynthesis